MSSCGTFKIQQCLLKYYFSIYMSYTLQLYSTFRTDVLHVCVVVGQGGPCQQRGDHSLFHACQRHLLQTGPGFCPQFPGDHLHETHLLWQLLRIRKFPRKVKKMSYDETLRLVARSQLTSPSRPVTFSFEFAFFLNRFFFLLFLFLHHSCGASSSKATDAKVIIALLRCATFACLYLAKRLCVKHGEQVL